MKIKRLQTFALRSTGKLVRVTKVVRSGFKHATHDLCTIADVADGRSIGGTQRVILSDSIRRRYFSV